MYDGIEYDLLRTFVAIVDGGSFTRAAELVNRSQSAISMQMKRLEDDIVQRSLFEREGRGVRLTPEGEMLLSYARRILKLHSEALNMLRQPDMVGSVRIGIPDDYVMRFLPVVLASFARSFPLVQVEVQCETTSSLLSRTGDNAPDLAIITCNPGFEQGTILRREQVVWATSERHCVHEQDPVPLALFDASCSCRIWACNAMDTAGRNYRIAYSSPSVSTIHAVVGAGLAVTALMQSIIMPGMRILGADDGFPPLPTTSVALIRPKKQPNRVLDCLSEHIIDGFRNP